jgi:hypothetical protein
LLDRSQALIRVALAAALLGSPAAARAGEPAPPSAPAPKTMAVYAEGVEAPAARADLAAILPSHLRVIDADSFTAALAKEGQRAPFGPALSHPQQRDRALAKLRRAAARVGAEAVIVARVRRDPGGITARLLWVPASGELVLDQDISLAGDGFARQEALRDALRAPLDLLAPSPLPAEPPPAPPATAPAPPAERIPGAVGTARIVVGLGLDVAGRWFRYSDPLGTGLRPYSLIGAPMPRVAAEAYPLAGTRVPILRDLGLTVSFAHAFEISSAVGKSSQLPTAWDRLRLGLRYRLRTNDLPFREASPEAAATSPVLGVSGGFGFDRFTVEATGSLAGQMPDAAYAHLYAGLDLRIPVWRFAFEARASYLGALSAGTVYERFRDPKLGGVSLGGGLAFHVGAGFEARAGADYERWFSSFHPVPGDDHVAGGALDHRVSIHIGAAYAH